MACESSAPTALRRARAYMVAWQPWAALPGFAFLLHFVWEMLQVPVYAGMIEATHGSAVRMCTIATAGDAVITLFAYGVVAVATRSRDWLGHITVGRLAGLVAGGIGMSLVAELLRNPDQEIVR